MKIYVLTNGVRDLDKSYDRELKNYTIYLDLSNNPHKCYIDLLNMAREEEDILILEDDLKLCVNFLQHIKEEVKKYSSYIINFFWQPLRNIGTTIETKGFCYTQCVYYPKGMINNFFKDLKEPNFNYAKNICQALEKNHIPFVNVRPHYLQHIGDKSLIYPGLVIRRSKQFIEEV